DPDGLDDKSTAAAEVLKRVPKTTPAPGTGIGPVGGVGRALAPVAVATQISQTIGNYQLNQRVNSDIQELQQADNGLENEIAKLNKTIAEEEARPQPQPKPQQQPSPTKTEQEQKKEGDLLVNRLGGGGLENLQLSESDRKGARWGLSVLLGGTPQAAADQARNVYPNSPAVQERSNTVGTTTAGAITKAGFIVKPDPSRIGANHALIQHPGGIPGYDANVFKLPPLFITTPTPPKQ
ncbi:MAG: hypothetical protein ABL921_34990, partial [Pirellula sp.]